MQYTHFEIKNFKGISHIRLDLDMPPKGKVITLVGLNESGKTTILDAMAYFRPAIDDPDPLILMELNRADPNDLIPIAFQSNFNDTIEISCGVELADEDEHALREYLRKEHNFRCTSIPRNFIVSDRYQFEDSVWDENRGALWYFQPKGMLGRARTEKHLRTANRAIWIEAINFLRKRMPRIWYFPNFLFDFPQRIYLEDRGTNDSRERFYRNLLSQVLATVDSTATLDRHITQRIQSDSNADIRALEQLLVLIGRQITKDVFGYWNEIFHRPQSTKAVVKPGKDDEGYSYVELSIEDSDGLYYISERSLGFRWFFVFSLVTRYAGLENGTPSVVFLFDEPASNLHAGAQSQLLGSLEKISDSSTIIYTTHSHHLINPKWLENTYVVRNTGFDYESSISEYTARKTDITIERYRSFSNKYPDQTRYFQPILDVLDYRPSQLELVPSVVMLEGKNDFYVLSYINDLILPKRRTRLNIVPGTGAGSLGPLIGLYVGWAKNFVVLLDSDTEGDRQKERYLEMFGPMLDGRLYTIGDFHSGLKGKSLEQAFDQADRDAITAVTYPGQAYTKKLFNRSIQECLAARATVQLSTATTQRFEEILTQIRKSLSEQGK